MNRDRSLALSASECAASAAKAVEPVKTAAPTLASVTPRPASRATNTVRVLSSGIARPLLSLATAHGMLDRQYHRPRREDGAPQLRLPAQQPTCGPAATLAPTG